MRISRDPRRRFEAFQREVSEFATRVIAPRVPDMERDKVPDAEIVHAMAQKGWIGLTIPKKYGGLALGHVAKSIAIEEVAYVSGAAAAGLQACQLGVAKILHFGNNKQKRRWLPEIAAGRGLPTIAVTDPEAGGHVLGMEATGKKDGDHYILNGVKMWVGSSALARWHGVIVDTGEGEHGLSAFVVPADTEGLELEPEEPMVGLHGFSCGRMTFHNARIPAANKLDGEGLHVAYSSSRIYGLPNLTALPLGLHRRLLDETVAFTKQRYRYGKPIYNLDSIRQRIGDMHSRLRANTVLAYQAVAALDDGEECDFDLINAKLCAVQGLLASCDDAMEIHGAHALPESTVVSRILRDAQTMRYPAGTNAFHRIRLANDALGIDPHRQWSEVFAGT